MNICIDVSLHVLCPATSPSSWKDKLRIRRIMDDRYHHRNRKQNKYNSLERQTYKSCVKTKYRCQAWCIRQQNKFCRANINSFKLRPMNRQNMASGITKLYILAAIWQHLPKCKFQHIKVVSKMHRQPSPQGNGFRSRAAHHLPHLHNLWSHTLSIVWLDRKLSKYCMLFDTTAPRKN